MRPVLNLWGVFELWYSWPSKREHMSIMILFILLLFLFFRAGERERGGAEGEREPSAGSMLSSEPDVGLDLTALTL